MSQKIKQRCLLLITFLIMGLFASLFTANYDIPTVLAKTASLNSVIKTENSAVNLEAQGKYFYSINQFGKALSLWQQAVEVYANSGDILSKGRVMASISLAYSKLDNWDKATKQITASLDLLDGEIVGQKIDREACTPCNRVLAQVLNNQGVLQLAQGQTEKAIATWQQASLNYERVGDQLGVIRTSINQASAFKSLGFYRRALKAR